MNIYAIETVFRLAVMNNYAYLMTQHLSLLRALVKVISGIFLCNIFAKTMNAHKSN